MQVGILGSLRVLAGHDEICVGPPQRRKVLAILLSGRRQVIGTGELVDCVWGEDPRPSAISSLHAHISHLRKSLGHVTIIRRPCGYVLNIEPDQFDADLFSERVRRGRTLIERSELREGRQQLSEALSLWRGHAYEEFDDCWWAQPDIVRLDAERLGAIVARIDVDLELGDTDVIGELEALVLEHPRHEGLCARLMVALYRIGRQADALAACRHHAHRLAESAGLQPTPTLRELELRILHHDPALTSQSGIR